MTRSRSHVVAAIAAAALIIVASAADARMGRGGGFGSRGARTFSPPPVTQTAPRPAQPLERTITQPGAAQRTPAATPAGAARTGMFGSGFGGAILGGLLGAGLFGLFAGHGFFGGIGGLGSILGLLLQIAIIFFVVRWIIGWFARRNQPAFASGNGRQPGPAPLRRVDLGSGGSAAARDSNDVVGIKDADFDAFGAALEEIQEAYGREDIATLRRKVTPEMLSYLSDELADNASRGQVNRVTDVKLLQGDLAEAWREGETDYATVAMRYALKDVTEDLATGRVVETGPGEVTEIWTFRRARGGSWLLSAIQQA